MLFRTAFYFLVAAFLLCACGSNSSIHSDSISECGGFDAGTLAVLKSTSGCNDMLNWQYDASKKTLTVLNAQVSLNCCGLHSIEVAEIDGGYEMTEVDMSKNGGRCLCMCLFDFETVIKDVAPESIKFVLKRRIEESGTKEIWNNSIDLTQNIDPVLLKEQSCWGK